METHGTYTLLIADDEPEILSLLEDYFQRCGYDVLAAASGAEALRLAQTSPDLVLLDVGMPDVDGLAVCRRLRDHVSCPILFLTARVDDAEVLAGFEAGGDDYITKPFSLAVLGARVAAHLAREGRRSARACVRFAGNVTIDFRERSVSVAQSPVELTRREFDILSLLARHAGQVFDRERIHEQVGGWDVGSSPAVVTEHIRRIRRKLSDAGADGAWLETVWGLGYRWRG